LAFSSGIIRQNTPFSGAWKSAHFKKYNFEAEGIYPNGGALHPLLKVREEMRNIFLEMGLVTTIFDPHPN
jgi:phenylalanyl-tRNA synthetase alpha chain